jgi:hypothetical protein
LASKSTKWLLGCGIGCGVIILIFVATGAGSYFLLKKTIEGFEEVGEIQADLEERFGEITEFVPAPDGSIAPDRLETFLRARELAASPREELEKTLTTLSDAEEGKLTPGVFIDAMMAGFDLLPGITSFLRHRNEAMLEAGIGPGEYLYVYAVAYYSWLGKSPADGPPFVLSSHDDDDSEEEEDERDAFVIREDRMEETRRFLNTRLTVMLRNQLAAAAPGGAGEGGDSWPDALAAEVELMEADPYRIPWQDGLPMVLDSSLEPFRKRLEESYCEICNPLEIAVD